MIYHHLVLQVYYYKTVLPDRGLCVAFLVSDVEGCLWDFDVSVLSWIKAKTSNPLVVEVHLLSRLSSVQVGQ